MPIVITEQLVRDALQLPNLTEPYKSDQLCHLPLQEVLIDAGGYDNQGVE